MFQCTEKLKKEMETILKTQIEILKQKDTPREINTM
jgi:hypothetical protein